MNEKQLILIAEDDDADFFLTQKALKDAGYNNPLKRAKDGEELIDFLHTMDEHTKPSVILLDLNMPRKDGREVLKEVKSNEKYKHIPIVVLTTSSAKEDILNTYKLGTNSYIQKPMKFDEYITVFKSFIGYWLGTSELPPVSLN